MGLILSKRAKGDLVRLREFVERKNPDAAQGISTRLAGCLELLSDHPDIGHPYEPDPRVLEWVEGNYIVHYTCANSTVFIVRIWHAREDR